MLGLWRVDLREFDVVYLAALVGMTQAEKEGMMANIVKTMRVGALVLIGSSQGLRTLLYPV